AGPFPGIRAWWTQSSSVRGFATRPLGPRGPGVADGWSGEHLPLQSFLAGAYHRTVVLQVDGFRGHQVVLAHHVVDAIPERPVLGANQLEAAVALVGGELMERASDHNRAAALTDRHQSDERRFGHRLVCRLGP